MRLLIATIFCIIYFSTTGQPRISEKLLNATLKSHEPIIIFSKNKSSQFINLDPILRGHDQKLIFSDTSAYCFIDGTGQLYKLQLTNSNYNFVRIDSTIFWGYNLGAFPFYYKGNIYNLGGVGLWRSNGHLRIFNEKAHEWDIVPINIEIPLTSAFKDGLISFDQESGKIYTAYYNIINDGLKSINSTDKFIYKVMLLDLNTKDWSYLGELNEELVKGVHNEANITMTPFGLLTTNSTNLKLWDFSHNKLYELKVKNPQIQTYIRGLDSTLFFFKNNRLFIKRGNDLDSEKINMNDFNELGSIYYYPVSMNTNGYKYIFYLLIIISLTIICSFYIKRFKVNIIRKHEMIKRNENENDKRKTLNFTVQERLLLQLLTTNSQIGLRTTIDQINAILGLETRPVETQKAQRHKLFTSINETYSSITDRKLIQNEKPEFDRRSNVYFILDEDVKIISSLLTP